MKWRELLLILIWFRYIYIVSNKTIYLIFVIIYIYIGMDSFLEQKLFFVFLEMFIFFLRPFLVCIYAIIVSFWKDNDNTLRLCVDERMSIKKNIYIYAFYFIFLPLTVYFTTDKVKKSVLSFARLFSLLLSHFSFSSRDHTLRFIV